MKYIIELRIANICALRVLNTADKYLWLPFKSGFERIMLLTESIYHSCVSSRPEKYRSLKAPPYCICLAYTQCCNLYFSSIQFSLDRPSKLWVYWSFTHPHVILTRFNVKGMVLFIVISMEYWRFKIWTLVFDS